LSTARTRKTTPRGCPRRGGSSTERSRAAPPPPSPLGQPASTHAAAQELHAAGRPWTRRSPDMDTRVEGGTPRLWRSSEVVRRRADRLSSAAALAAVNDAATTFPVE
jgi:hypothetical protein